MVKKIAFEEHFLTPGLIDYWSPTMADVDRKAAARLLGRLTDFGDMRLDAMNAAGIERAVLSVAGPGVQAERDTVTACRVAAEANDVLATEIARQPGRYIGLGHLALQDADFAARELERCVRELNFCGVLINGHTNGQYLDDPSLSSFWERAAALGALVYLHPADPLIPAPVLDGHNALRRATWEWGFETGSHALRLIFGGVFDRYPRARVVLGHLGETLPYLLWRLDSRAAFFGAQLAKPPSQYIRDHFLVTCSGMYSAEPLYCAITALGRDKVMFGADYPFEDSTAAGQFIDTVPLDEGLRADVAWKNAERVLGLA